MYPNILNTNFRCKYKNFFSIFRSFPAPPPGSLLTPHSGLKSRFHGALYITGYNITFKHILLEIRYSVKLMVANHISLS